ncbi:hypothetical protein TGMAS_209005 [Toxoplasma gondii MAS]|uniref:Uncharacterized protein n=1 Tax=Toxoplasma gondii MAS TaxID=943118 RepID=A0A086QSE9_TOXGO|nr:hypothetical protein TGMAS_209005 [Toxoplasma gondii MAS]
MKVDCPLTHFPYQTSADFSEFAEPPQVRPRRNKVSSFRFQDEKRARRPTLLNSSGKRNIYAFTI